MIEFNQQQLDIIHSLHTNTMVSASAGAGKTTVLIGRLIKRIIEDKLSIDQICAMTFTEKAAAEMKNRLSNALGQELKKNPNDERIKQQFILLADAQISTIHSFCLSIIKEFGYLNGIDPKRTQNILDDQAVSVLQDLATQQVLTQLLSVYKDDETFINLLNFFNFKIVDYHDFSVAFRNLAEVAQSNLDPQSFYQQLLKTYQSTTFEAYPSFIQDLFFVYGQVHIDTLHKNLDTMENLFYQADKQDEQFYDQLQQHRLFLTEANQFLKQRNNKLLLQSLMKAMNIPLKMVRKQEYSAFRKEYIKSANKALDYFYQPQDLSPSYPYVSLLVEAALLYTQCFNQLKQERKGLDFNDIEHFAYQLLQNRVVTESLKNRYEEILVDEFQDSNHFQNEIVNLISKQDNVFRVGDIKQSIYGFRNAKPELMKNIMIHQDQFNKTLYLSKNFRSSYNIVHFNNLLFEKLMNIEGSSLSFDELDKVDIGVATQKEIKQPVEIRLLDSKQEIEYSGFNKPSFSSAMRIAYFIGQDIQRKVDNKEANFKDICVLIRSHSRKKELKRAFDDLNIPYYIEDRDGFYHAYSVQDTIHFLRFIMDPHNNHHLTWVLLSGYVNFTEQQLSDLYLVDPSQSLFTNLKHYNHDLFLLFNNLMTLYQQVESQTFVHHLLNVNDYYHRHLDTQQRTNIDLLMQRLSNYLSKPHQGLLGFIQEVQAAIDLESSNASSISEDDNVVRVYTVHQSKGLEYPVVYFFSFKSHNRDQDLKNKVSMDADLGLSIGLMDFENNTHQKNLYDVVFETHKQIETSQEEIRNLYVALTRAKHHLMIVDMDLDSDFDEIQLADLMAGDNYIKLILKALANIQSDTFVIQHQVQLNPIQATLRKVETVDMKVRPLQPMSQEVILDPKQELTLSLNLQSHFATDYGTLIHQLLMDESTKDSLNELPQDIQIKLTHYYQHPLTQQLNQYPQQHEVAIAYLENDQVVYGYMDLIIETDDEVMMVDYKTDLVDDLNVLKARYQKQMDSYLKGLVKVYPNKKIKQYLYSFNLHQYIAL